MSENFVSYPNIGYTTLTVSSSVVTFTDCGVTSLITQPGLRKVIFQVDPAGGNCRYTLDGSTDPVGASAGIRADAGDIVELDPVEAKNFKALYDDGATDATLQCHFYYTD
jgi:hypothetical protein